MCILHGGLRRLGVADGALLPSIPALGHAGPSRAHVRSGGHCATGFLLLCHRYEHCSAYIALCFCRGESTKFMFCFGRSVVGQ